ncbi:hypothetical protein Ae505Ps2_6242 [Pseudonocardia sp. Ae505_Ps2]|nr:hypothetical protein Ae505Ps2_6242 [Pseudonocardia sp. Ae505_Ps2]
MRDPGTSPSRVPHGSLPNLTCTDSHPGTPGTHRPPPPPHPSHDQGKDTPTGPSLLFGMPTTGDTHAHTPSHTVTTIGAAAPADTPVRQRPGRPQRGPGRAG